MGLDFGFFRLNANLPLHGLLNHLHHRRLVIGCHGLLELRALGGGEDFLKQNLHQNRFHLFGDR